MIVHYMAQQTDTLRVVRAQWRRHGTHPMTFGLPYSADTGLITRVSLVGSEQTSPLHYRDTLVFDTWCSGDDAQARVYAGTRNLVEFLHGLVRNTNEVELIELISGIIPDKCPVLDIPKTMLTVALTVNGKRLNSEVN